MKIVVIGASGTIGSVVSRTLEGRGHEVVRASRSTEPRVDLADEQSIAALFEQVGTVDGIVVASGEVPFKPLGELGRDDYLSAFSSKVLGQLDVVRLGLPHVSDGGSITLTTGVIAREPIATGAAAGMANGALESFVITAAAEAPRGIRINAVSPNVLESAPDYHPYFPGQRPVTDEEVGTGYVLAVEGLVNGRTVVV